MSKIKLLFVIESLAAAGAEKSLVALLNELDFSLYEVDLQLFSYGKEFEKYLPVEVNLLEPLEYFSHSKDSLLLNLMSLSPKRINNTLKRLTYSLLLCFKKLNNLNKAKLLWQISGNNLKPRADKTYDVAIAYAQGLPTYYVNGSIRANKKIAWVNVSLDCNNNDNNYQLGTYEAFDNIVIVSDASYEIFTSTFPTLKEKTTTIYDITSSKLTNAIKSQPIDLSFINGNGLKLLTMGRLAHQKGYDFAICAAELLKNRGVDFTWYFLGDGPLKAELHSIVLQKNLSEQIKLIGIKSNPLAIIENVDIYVQPSRYEGFGLALFEARSLQKPCIATNFETASLQIKHGVNGQIVGMVPREIANAILQYIENPEFTQQIIDEQAKCKFFNSDEVHKFNNLIKELTI